MKPRNRGYDYRRTFYQHGNNRERVFADKWEEENKPISWLNHGWGSLQDLFFEYHPPFDRLGIATCAKVLTNRDRMVAATAIQWLGTNCGWRWLEETLLKCGYKLQKVSEQCIGQWEEPTIIYSKKWCCPICESELSSKRKLKNVVCHCSAKMLPVVEHYMSEEGSKALFVDKDLCLSVARRKVRYE